MSQNLTSLRYFLLVAEFSFSNRPLLMPFTVTHIAAAVPVAWLCRWRVPFSALAIGTMVPDLSGFYPALFDKNATHSMTGILTHCTPIGVMGYYAYHAILKQPLVDLLPRWASDRLRPWTEKPIDFSPLAIFAVFACVALGAATHVFWDSFTHGGSWGVGSFPSLKNVLMEQGGRPVRWYSLVQHGSSIILLPPLLLGFIAWIRKQPRAKESIVRAQMPRSISWTMIALMSIGTLMYFHTMWTSNPQLSWLTAVRFAVKDSGAVVLVVTLLYCLGMHYVWWREQHRDPCIHDTTTKRIVRER